MKESRRRRESNIIASFFSLILKFPLFLLPLLAKSTLTPKSERGQARGFATSNEEDEEEKKKKTVLIGRRPRLQMLFFLIFLSKKLTGREAMAGRGGGTRRSGCASTRAAQGGAEGAEHVVLFW